MNKKMVQNRQSPKRLLSIPETAEYLGRTEIAIRDMISAGKLPYVRADRRIFCDIRELERWIENNKVLELI